jgi:hypothetical protein
MNSAELASSFIQRVRNLKTFQVQRSLDDPLSFTRGPVPFDIKANQEYAWFSVLAVSQQEAEEMVDRWLEGTHD